MSTSPGFSATPNSGTPGALTAANTALDGTGTTLLIFTAGSLGALIDRIRCMHKGTNVATVARVFLNNGSDPSVAGNNTLIGEKTMPANTLSQVAESVSQDIVLNHPMEAGERIYVSIGTAVAAGVQFTPVGGDL